MNTLLRDAFVKAVPQVVARLDAQAHDRDVAVAEEAMAVKARIDAADDMMQSILLKNVPGEGRTLVFRQNLGRSIYGKNKYRVWQMARESNQLALEKFLSAIKFFWAGAEAHRYACDLITGKAMIEIKKVSLAGLTGPQILDKVRELTGQSLSISPKSKARIITKAVAILTAHGVVVLS